MSISAPRRAPLVIESDGTLFGTKVWVNGVEVRGIRSVEFRHSARELPELIVRQIVRDTEGHLRLNEGKTAVLEQAVTN